MGTIAPLGELSVDLLCLRPFDLKVSSLNVIVDSIESIDKSVELLQLLSKDFLTGKNLRLVLALVFLLLVGGFFVPHHFVSWRHCHKTGCPDYFSSISVGLFS